MQLAARSMAVQSTAVHHMMVSLPPDKAANKSMFLYRCKFRWPFCSLCVPLLLCTPCPARLLQTYEKEKAAQGAFF
jgi:hypothetical protein